ncbi:MAG: hypothetical protein H7831_11130 [Magnetococcus sp. WYHC-3]
MSLLRAIPLFAWLLAIYNLMAFGLGADFSTTMDRPYTTFSLHSGAELSLNLWDLLILTGVMLLYVEIFKATRNSRAAILDHLLSMMVFVVFLVEFLLLKDFGTTPFLSLTMMSFLDVVAGFTVSIAGAGRDVSVGRG